MLRDVLNREVDVVHHTRYTCADVQGGPDQITIFGMMSFILFWRDWNETEDNL